MRIELFFRFWSCQLKKFRKSLFHRKLLNSQLLKSIALLRKSSPFPSYLKCYWRVALKRIHFEGFKGFHLVVLLKAVCFLGISLTYYNFSTKHDTRYPSSKFKYRVLVKLTIEYNNFLGRKILGFNNNNQSLKSAGILNHSSTTITLQLYKS